MLFKYTATDQTGSRKEGTIDAMSIDAAITTLQRRGYVVSAIDPLADRKKNFIMHEFTLLEHVSNKEIVMFSRQIATLFEAQVSPLRVFRLLATETENPLLRKILDEISEDLQAGTSISNALAQHPEAFSVFYVAMVKSGEESGRLDQVFLYLADYLDRTYEVMSKARNAMIYPAFVVMTFIVVMGLMMTLVIPNISSIITDSGQAIPFYTWVIVSISNFLVKYIAFILLFTALGGFLLWRFIQTEVGARTMDELRIATPFVGDLFTKLYLSRIADTLSTMLQSGISMIAALEITGKVVGNRVYEEIIENTIVSVKGGRSLSDSLAEYSQMPGVLVQMVKVGEESGNLGSILDTLAKFYRREVNGAVDTLVSLIEPVMIVMLGLGVGVLLAAVLIPIYNISTAI